MSAPREISLASVRKLKPNKRNARTHSKKQIGEITALIQRFGWTYPILVDDEWRILAGHARYQAALYLGLTRVPVIIMAGLSDAEKRALAIADNKVPTNAGWDRAALAAELGELAELLPNVGLTPDITGFEPAEIDTLLVDLIDPERDPADQLPQIEQIAVSQTGDLWQLGHHRLGCNDARDAVAMRQLMAGEQAAMVCADPPFNDRISSIGSRGQIKHREFALASGEMSSAEFTTFLKDSLGLAARYSVDGSLHLVFMDWRHQPELHDAGKAVYGTQLNLIVWKKNNAGQGSFYRSQHELIYLFKKGTASHTNNIQLGRHGRNRSNVWEYPGVNSFGAGRLETLALHPTVKPVALISDAMRDCSRRGDIILDPFMGSGTTILAAEKIGRRTFGLEIDTLYIDVAIRRWQAFTRRDAILAATGQTFSEIAKRRSRTTRVRA
jgi:DNA modification methylase